MKKVLSIITILLLGFYVNVYAATTNITVSPESIKAGDSFQASVLVRGTTAWNVHLTSTGETDNCSIAQAGYTEDLEAVDKTFTVNCVAKNKGTIVFTLSGDYTDGNGTTTEISDTKTINVTAGDNPVTNTYTVTFDSNGGSNVASQTVNKDAKATKPANPTKDGYSFKEWQLNGQTYDFNTPVTGNITLTAVWINNGTNTTTYTVTFDSNGGSNVASQTINENDKVTKPANPTRSGYTFKEWQLNGKAYDFNTKVTGNITLKAVWTENKSNQKNTIKISVPLTGEDVIKGTPNEETGEIVNKYPVYVTQTVENEIKSISITVGNKASTVKDVSFEAVTPYELTKDGDKATFAVGEGQTGKSGKKELVGYVVVTLSADTATPFEITSKKVNGAKTGASVNVLAIALGLVSVGAISLYVTKKRRMI